MADRRALPDPTDAWSTFDMPTLMNLNTRRFVLRTIICFAAAVAIVACAAGPNAGSGPRTRSDPSRIDSTELRAHDYVNIYEAVSATHAEWLIPRGGGATNAAGDAPTVGVFIEGQQRNRGLSYLREIRPIEVKSIRHLTSSESLNAYGWPWGAIIVIPR